MEWIRAYRNDPQARAIADRYYNRQSIGAPGFVPPGRCLVLLTGGILSSALIVDAIAATRWTFGAPSALGMVTFIDRKKTRQKRDPGYCYLCAGFEPVGETESGLVVLRMKPEAMPEPVAAESAEPQQRWDAEAPSDIRSSVTPDG